MEEKNEKPVKKVKKIHKKKDNASSEKAKKVNGASVLKNTLLITLACILFLYAGIITFTGKIATNSFNTEEFVKKANEATGFVTEIDSFKYKVTPNLHGIITVYDLSADWVGNQKLFSAKKIVIETNNPFSIFTKNFDINNMYLSDVLYADQHLDNGENKLNSFPSGFNCRPFGSDKIVIKPGKVKVKNLKITYTTPDSYDEKIIKEKEYPKQEVQTFLYEHPFVCVSIK